MRENKLIKLLISLKKEELRGLKKYLSSPFFNNNQHITRLFEYLRKYHPSFPEEKIEKERVFSHLFPGLKYNYEKIRTLIKKLTRLVDDYLLWLELQEEDFDRRKTMTKIYGKRNIYNLFERGTNNLLKEIQDNPQKNEYDFLRAFELNYNFSFHPQTNRYKKGKIDFEQLLDDLDGFSSLTKLRLQCEINNRERTMASLAKVKTDQFHHLNAPESNPLNKVFSNLLELYKPDVDFESYQTTKLQFVENLPFLKKADIIFALQQLINFSIRRMHQEPYKYNTEAFEMYKIGVKEFALVEDNRISNAMFSNIVSVGCFLKEFDWVETFIEEYEQYLEPKSKEDIIAMVKGELFFSNGNYQKVIDLISVHQFSDALLQLKSRINLLKAWIEEFLKDHIPFDFVISQLQAYQKFIRRNSALPEKRKEGFLNFSKVLTRIVEFHSKKRITNQNNQKLLDYYHATKVVIAKSWLEEKIKGLSSNR